VGLAAELIGEHHRTEVRAIVGLHHVVVGPRREETQSRGASAPLGLPPEGRAGKLGVKQSGAGGATLFWLRPGKRALESAFC
jgi:hypothetical protein